MYIYFVGGLIGTIGSTIGMGLIGRIIGFIFGNGTGSSMGVGRRNGKGTLGIGGRIIGSKYLASHGIFTLVTP